MVCLGRNRRNAGVLCVELVLSAVQRQSAVPGGAGRGWGCLGGDLTEDNPATVLGGERRTRRSWGLLPGWEATELVGNRERGGLVGRDGQCGGGAVCVLCTCVFLGAQTCGEGGGRAGGTVQNLLSSGPGKTLFPASLLGRQPWREWQAAGDDPVLIQNVTRVLCNWRRR